jgi:glycosidase
MVSRSASGTGPRWAAAAVGVLTLLGVTALVLLLLRGDPFRSGGFTAEGPATGDRSALPLATRVALAKGWDGGSVCYEIFVRSFQDSDGDGIGDLQGLIQRLDYVNDGDPSGGDDLGADCIWLMPTFPSGSYHGYDVTDYRGVNPELGTLEDMRLLVAEARARGIRILLDLVINHTSDRHPWFLEASRGPDAPHRGWYRFAEEPGPDNEYGDNNWRPSPGGDDYYYGFFSPRMPDLDWENPELRAEMRAIADFWLLDVGVDGFRVDAVRHLMEDEDGRSTNIPRTHSLLADFGSHVRQVAPGAITIGEVFDSTAALLPYYPDQFDSYFAFQLANGIVDAARTGQRGRLFAAVEELQERLPGHRWSSFIRNHDQTRTLTELGGDPARGRVAASLLLTLPGLPFVYYGEEIGMTGDKPDPRLRTPMQWTGGPGVGFTDGTPWEPPQPLAHQVNVAVQEVDSTSLLHHYRRLIHLRRTEPALGRGLWVPLDAGTEGVAAFLRRTETEALMVVVNLQDRPSAPLAISGGPGSLPPGVFRMEPISGFTPDDLETRARAVRESGFEGWAVPSVPAHGTLLARIRAGDG